MLTGKQRSYLKSIANGMDAVVYIGKSDLTDTALTEMDNYLNAHEIVKVKLQEGTDLDPKEAANECAGRLHAEFVQAIGRKFVLFRPNKDKRQIFLPK